jgi:bifunctional DNA-binding transcriptional regulator/antitoxin component of YhaV-PrlF toxin-antitoxin module
MPEVVRVVARVKKVGNSLAVFIPATDARKAGLEEGQLVEAIVRPHAPDVLGLLRDLPHQPFQRRREGDWRERV